MRRCFGNSCKAFDFSRGLFTWKELSAGPALFAMYHKAVVNLRKIPVRYNTPAVRLIVDGGRVAGVQAGKEGALRTTAPGRP